MNYPHTVDLQYHAGQERQADLTLEDYVEHAALTGRKILGLTDHVEIYLGLDERTGDYERSIEGLKSYRADMERVQQEFPELQLLFAPEIGTGVDLQSFPAEIIELSDFFICELPFPSLEEAPTNTDARLERLDQIEAFRDRADRQVFIAHPFRSAVNKRLIKQDIEPWIREMEPRSPEEFTHDDVVSFFQFDVKKLANAAATADIPLEINGNTHYRVRSSNLPSALQLLRAGYQFMQNEGAEFVSGSDQHGFQSGIGRAGEYIPWETFAHLDVGVRDLYDLTAFGVAGEVAATYEA